MVPEIGFSQILRQPGSLDAARGSRPTGARRFDQESDRQVAEGRCDEGRYRGTASSSSPT